MMQLTTQIEIAVAEYFGWRQNIIVPNVFWGAGLLYEADMIVVRPSGFAVEVEIKITRADVIADKKKKHQHDSNMFKQLWFAVPEKLKDCVDIPERAGIIAAFPHEDKWFCRVIRQAAINKDAVKLDADKIKKLLHLGCMRVWALKGKILKMQEKQGEIVMKRNTKQEVDKEL